MSQFICFCCVEGLFLLWSSMWYMHRRYRKLLQSSWVWNAGHQNQFRSSCPVQAAPLWLSHYPCWLCSDHPVCSPWPSRIPAPGTVLQWKFPHGSRSADEVPPTPQTSSIALSLPNICILVRNVQAKPEPSTVALLLNCDAFYIMCASGTFPSVFFDYSRYIARKEVCFSALFWIASWEPL